MSLETDIKQLAFRNEQQKAMINLIYTYNWVMEQVRHILEQVDLTVQQYNILRILRGSFPTPLSTLQIRERMLDKMSDTSRIVDRLVLKQLVDKKTSGHDKRLVDVMITDKGKDLLENMGTHQKELDGVLDQLNDVELIELNRLLDKIRKS